MRRLLDATVAFGYRVTEILEFLHMIMNQRHFLLSIGGHPGGFLTDLRQVQNGLTALVQGKHPLRRSPE